MQNALLYTFSTIAQALGGAFALLAAFVLYRFEVLSLPSDSAHVRGELTRGGDNFERYDTLRIQGRWLDLMAEIAAIRERTKPAISPSVEKLIERMSESARVQGSVAKWFWRAAITTGAVMFYSVAAIPFAHLVYCFCALSWLLLSLGIGGFLACLLMFFAVINAALYEK
jgi:hypothetical protein